MCGIVGYIGERDALPILLEGLKRVEYRGYDSAGFALVGPEGFECVRRVGKVSRLVEAVRREPPKGHVGTAHTRWATHGAVTEANAHPHLSSDGRVVVVHNGIIENYESLKALLVKQGFEFRSETDTEVIANLIASLYEDDLDTAVKAALRRIRGTYGLVVSSHQEPNVLIAARNGSSVMVGLGDDECIIASDPAAIVAHMRQIIYLNDGEVARVTREGVRVTDLADNELEREVEWLDMKLEEIERGEHRHFMHKEIHEQSSVVRRAVQGRLSLELGDAHLGGLNLTTSELLAVEGITMIASGGSLNAARAAAYVIEEFARLPCRVESAGELISRNPIVTRSSLYFAVSQSGETADTLAAIREVIRKGGTSLGVVNVVGSTIAREIGRGIYVRAGREVAVCSTKAYLAQFIAMTLVALKLGRMRDVSRHEGIRFCQALQMLPAQIDSILDQEEHIAGIAAKIVDTQHMLFVGRGPSESVALEGPRKMKEIAYITCEGMSASELKHGPLALVSEGTPLVAICPSDHVRTRTLANISEARARGAMIIGVGDPKDSELAEMSAHLLPAPSTHELLSPALTVISLQLLAYHVALLRGLDIDQPRNLAKSVTVE
jgi:glucosamine--fructose-6-phosphate aminotransferase (isomerizing)